MPTYGMVIDLLKCAGCGACGLACKTGNNTQDRKDGQSYNWADYMIEVEGKFPEVRYTNYPVLCNHCANAPCVEACPVEPKAMFKSADGLTLHNSERCIGCLSCQDACPYSVDDLDSGTAQYSVISFNPENQASHSRYREESRLYPGTVSGAEIAQFAGAVPPYRTEFSHPDYDSVRRPGIVEKCIFCDHRIQNGLQPYCVEACPSEARVFGDLSDGGSEVAKLLKTNDSVRLKVEEGTEPRVYYINKFKA
ncbi:MAG: 4Fe-4S dicluster domain-containing protein [Desulforhopalus sp.]|nr:4Fe-4S dicluster domain-containing protein [Desulforhopalus sp.]